MQKITITGLLLWMCMTGVEAQAQECVQPLSESVFKYHKQSLEKASFEEDRMKMATTFLNQKKCMKVSQIKSVIQLLNFEDNQIAFAKLAYDFTHDPENYQEIIAIFTEAPIRKTLTRYINKRK